MLIKIFHYNPEWVTYLRFLRIKDGCWATNWSSTLVTFQHFLLMYWNRWSMKGKKIWNLKNIYRYGYKPIEE